MSTHQLTVLTYNLHKGFNTSRSRFTLPAMRKALREANADVMLLQEIQGEHHQLKLNHKHWPEEPQFKFLAGDDWPYFAYGKNAIYNLGHHGNAILSKYPMPRWENINVSPFKWASRSLLHSEITLPGSEQTVHIICIHLGLFGLERRYQFETLCERIDSHVPHDAPLIIAGDFNDWAVQAAQQLSHHLHLKEAYQTLHNRHARTWPSWMPVLKMDRIYYRGVQPITCQQPKNIDWHRFSDHAPLLATFSL